MNNQEKALLQSEMGYARNRVNEGLDRLERLRDEQIDRIEGKLDFHISTTQYNSANIEEIKRLLRAMNEPKREPVIDVTGIVDMKRDEWAGEFYDVRIDLNDDLTDLLEPFNGKRVRVTVEVIEEVAE